MSGRLSYPARALPGSSEHIRAAGGGEAKPVLSALGPLTGGERARPGPCGRLGHCVPPSTWKAGKVTVPLQGRGGITQAPGLALSKYKGQWLLPLGTGAPEHRVHSQHLCRCQQEAEGSVARGTWPGSASGPPGTPTAGLRPLRASFSALSSGPQTGDSAVPCHPAPTWGQGSC